MKKLFVLSLVCLAIGCTVAYNHKWEKKTKNPLYPPEQEPQAFIIDRPIQVWVVNPTTLDTLGIQSFSGPLRGLHISNTYSSTIIVPYSTRKDKDGNYTPDFEALGHEVWHEVMGHWHDP